MMLFRSLFNVRVSDLWCGLIVVANNISHLAYRIQIQQQWKGRC